MATNSLAGGSPLTSFLIDKCDDITSQVSDTVDLTAITISLAVNTSGLVKLHFQNSAAPITRFMIAGIDYPWRVKRIYSTGTDAAVITGKIYGMV